MNTTCTQTSTQEIFGDSVNTVKVEIAKIVGGGICVTADDGKRVYNVIHEQVEAGHRVQLSFANVTRMTTAFLNAAVGQLYGDFSEDVVKDRLAPPIDYASWHLTRLKMVVDRAKIFFKDPSAADDIFDSE